MEKKSDAMQEAFGSPKSCGHSRNNHQRIIRKINRMQMRVRSWKRRERREKRGGKRGNRRCEEKSRKRRRRM